MMKGMTVNKRLTLMVVRVVEREREAEERRRRERRSGLIFD